MIYCKNCQYLHMDTCLAIRQKTHTPLEVKVKCTAPATVLNKNNDCIVFKPTKQFRKLQRTKHCKVCSNYNIFVNACNKYNKKGDAQHMIAYNVDYDCLFFEKNKRMRKIAIGAIVASVLYLFTVEVYFGIAVTMALAMVYTLYFIAVREEEYDD